MRVLAGNHRKVSPHVRALEMGAFGPARLVTRDDKSRISREAYVRICGSRGLRFPRPPDQAAEDRFSANPARVEVCCGAARSGVRVRDALVDALMRPGGVVMLLVLGQDRSQVRLVQDQGPVEDLTAQGADKALADRVHPRRLHRGAHDGGPGGLEDGIEGRGEVRAAVADQEPEVPEPLTEVEGQVAGLLVSATVSTCRKSAARIPAACACRNCRQVRPSRRGAGSMPAARRIS